MRPTVDREYRGDIDGLRALAVLGVLLFHCEVALLPGGFVGVDVFFAISGYLITRNIMQDHAAGRFSFAEFYVRRVRRLLPALIATMAATLLACAAIMAPADLAMAGRSAMFAAVSLSNFHFAAADDYFAPASDLKPFLHTWSLSVEEQFYLVWPVTLVAALRLGGPRAAAWVVGLGALGGIALSEAWIHVQPKHAYFLTPARGYQFMFGAACVWLTSRRCARPALEAAVLALGLALIVASMAALDETTPFPGVAGVLPALGAALTIWAGRAPVLTRVLDNRAARWLGAVSYSVYLVHWPIVVLRRYLTGEHFSPAEQAALAIASIVAGWALHVAVERRFLLDPRRRPAVARWRIAAPVGVASVAVAAAGAALHAADGLPERMALRPAAAALNDRVAFQFLREHEDGALRLGRAETGVRVLIVGDSMMQNYVPALLDAPWIGAAEVDVVTRGGCILAEGLVRVNFGAVDRDCAALRDTALAGKDYDLVIWSQNWWAYGGNLARRAPDGALEPVARATPGEPARWADVLPRAAAAWAARGARLAVIGPQIAASGLSPLVSRIGPAADLDRIRASLAALRPADLAAQARLSAEIARLVEAAVPEAVYIDPRDLVCADDSCAMQADGVSFYLDSIHHTAAATPMLATRLASLLPEPPQPRAALR